MQEREPLEVTTFGELLKLLRKRQGLSQQRLAARLGVHRNTIGTWERGDFLPDSKGMVLELARHLQLDSQETRQLLEASLIALSAYWYVPYPRNPFFTGREELLQTLHARLTETVGASCYALSGLGGVGKTQTALEYAYLHAEEYSAVFWCDASTRDTLLISFQAIARALQFSPGRGLEDEIISSVLHWLTNHSGWLLIFDNVEDLALLQEFLPLARSGAILLTTRLTALQGLGHIVSLQPFTAAEGRVFLAGRLWTNELSPVSSKKQEHDTLSFEGDALVEALGGLPLALDQAATYIEETQCGPGDFLHLLEAYPADLLQHQVSIAGHSLPVFKTFQVSIEQVQGRQIGAVELLTLCAFLAGESIPEEMISQGASSLDSDLRSLLTEPLRRNAALRELLSYSLIGRSARGKLFTMHRLVQMVVRESLPLEERQRWILMVTRMLEALFPLDLLHEDYWQRCEWLLPHVYTALSHAEQWSVIAHPIAFLSAKVAGYLLARTRYEEAESFGVRARDMLEQLDELSHPDMIYVLSILATLSSAQGRYMQAQQLLQQAIQVNERQLERRYQSYAAYCLSKLAALYAEQSRKEEAETLFQQALHTSQLLLAKEEEHSLLATAFSELAQLCVKWGQLQQAEELFRQAIQLCEQSFTGAQSPYLAISLTNLASLYFKQGRYEEAQALSQRFISLERQGLRTRHPYLY
ncbi:XRE family transcriptional regulator [Ktedonobacter racemifer]|uniref:Transcriptional regulator, XRE family n=1 Tax=Ktedonobacter racemifer DSM 44963 TaxID=485913 RepID=D6TVY0_KTERA|nr:XRE family transcriptional regulator [Ktedonobacter racemifer]EFH84363.1 transcriptional regulator, XRE family [Ktedonobacter racemifer DSM 44963]